MSTSTTARTVLATGLVATLAAALGLTGATTAQADPGHAGTPAPPVVVFHEDFEQASDTGDRTLLADYVGKDGKRYTADPYWLDPVKANGMVLSWGNTRVASDGTGAGNGTQVTAFNTL